MSQKYKSFSRNNGRMTEFGSLPPGVKRMGYLRKLKKMKRRFFVLHMESNYGVARLEYYNSEKKWKFGCEPKRCIELKSCLNIGRKLHSKHKNVIALYTEDDSFSIVLDSTEELELWLNDILEVHRVFMEMDENVNRRHVYEHLWQVVIDKHDLEYDKLHVGPYRVALTSKSLHLIKLNPLNEDDYLEFPLMSIRRCGHSKDHFFIELGRSAVTGAGEIYMATEATIIAQNMHETVLSAMKSSKIREDGNIPSRPRSASTSDNSNPPTVKRPVGVVTPQTLSCSGLSGSRERCDSLPSRTQAIASSGPYNINFSPSSLSGCSSSTEEVDNVRHHSSSCNPHPVSANGNLSSATSIIGNPNEYLMMSPTEVLEINPTFNNTTVKKISNAPLKINDYVDMKSSGSSSATAAKVDNYMSMSQTDSLKDNCQIPGYMDMSPSNSLTKNSSSYLCNVPLQIEENSINSACLPFKLDKVLSRLKVEENLIEKNKEASSNPKTPVIIEDDAGLSHNSITQVNPVIHTRNSLPLGTKPPIPEKTYRRSDSKMGTCPPLTNHWSDSSIKVLPQTSWSLGRRSTATGHHRYCREDFIQNDEQEVFYSTGSLGTPKSKSGCILSPEQNTNFSCMSNCERIGSEVVCSHSCCGKDSAAEESPDPCVDQVRDSALNDSVHNISKVRFPALVCDNSEINLTNDDSRVGTNSEKPLFFNQNDDQASTFNQEVLSDNYEGQYVNVDLKQPEQKAKLNPQIVTNVKNSLLLQSQADDPNYSNIQFGKHFCPTPNSIPASSGSPFVPSERNFRMTYTATPIPINPADNIKYIPRTGSGVESPKTLSLMPRLQNLSNTLPAFRKQMSAPAAPLSLRPELPSPGRKSSCPVTASASMLRSSVPVTSVRPAHLVHGATTSRLRVSNSRSPDHSSVSSVSSASDEISSAHSSPKTVNAPQGVPFDQNSPSEQNDDVLIDVQYENVVLPLRSSRPPSVSSERELNYAMLDLCPATKNPTALPRSPTVPKPSVSLASESSSYAEIDFTKSEGLKTISGSLRDGRL